MNQNKSTNLPNYIAIALLAGYFIIGLFISRDYGLNWDDPLSRDNGVDNCLYLSHTDRDALLNTPEKYHGPAFEILLVGIEKAFHLRDKYKIFAMRHYVVSLFFISVLIAFFLFCRGLFQNNWMGLLGMSLLLFTPRIFGESFYNSKDIAFLGGMVWSLYSLWCLARSPSPGRAVFLAFTNAFAMDVRVLGVLFFPITIALLALYIYEKKFPLRQISVSLLLYIVSFFCFMILMWPIMMEGVVVNLSRAFRQMSNYSPWIGNNTYLGQLCSSVKTPWHYHWVWIIITTPEIYLLAFLAGIFVFIAKLFGTDRLGQSKIIFLSISLFLFFFPLIFRSITLAVVYDGWRHVYFIFPFFLVLVVFAADEALAYKKRTLGLAVVSVLAIGMADSAVAMIAMHPYEYVYFNHSANTLLKPIDQNFDMDYWGVSYRKGIEYILSQQKSNSNIKVAFGNYPGEINAQCLPPDEQKHVESTSSIDSADYYITNYRCHLPKQDIPTPTSVKPMHLIRAQGNIVLGIYKMK